MPSKRVLWWCCAIFGLVVAPNVAAAAKYIVYVHGRSMSGWPVNGRLGASAEWTHIDMTFNGSARLADASVRQAVRSTIAAYCTSTDCVVACYSAGCARTLLAFEDLRAMGTPASRVLWVQATASAAGGSELAALSTNNGIRLIAKIFGVDVPSESIDKDLDPGTMRGTFGFMQNGAPAPVYHLAGSKNICRKVKIGGIIGGIIAGGVSRFLGYGMFSPQGLIIGAIGRVLGNLLFGSAKIKLCGNSSFPGGHGDGAVPVHSAAGYADTGSHGNHADGGPKYVFRAYEQVPLFDYDHTGMFAPFVYLGSIRLAVPRTATCPNLPPAEELSPASIVYEDADGAPATESPPLMALQICGNDVWNGIDNPLYATCYGTDGCCDNFSTGNTGACTCGEALCIQARSEYRSYFTGVGCSGTEYAPTNLTTWDGTGMVGNVSTTVTVQSARIGDGTCKPLVHKTTYRGGCPEFNQTSMSLTGAHRVYRPGIPGYAVDAQATGLRNGIVVTSNNYIASCP